MKALWQSSVWWALGAASIFAAYLLGQSAGLRQSSVSEEKHISHAVSNEPRVLLRPASRMLSEKAAVFSEVAGMTTDEVQNALRLLQEQAGSPGVRERERVLWRRFAELDPERAARAALGTAALGIVLEVWADSDFSAAWSWVPGNIPTGVQQELYQHLFAGLVEAGHGREAISKLLEVIGPAGNYGAGSWLAGLLIRYDLDRLPDLLEALPEGNAREGAMYTWTVTWMLEDVRGALEWGMGIEDRRLLGAAISQPLGHFVRTEGADEALAWVRSQPPSRNLDHAKGTLATYLSGGFQPELVSPPRLDDAFRLILEISNPTAQIGLLGNLLDRAGPAQAAAYAEQIPPGRHRTQALGNYIVRLHRQDPAATGEFLNAASFLSPDEREAIQQRLPVDLPSGQN